MGARKLLAVGSRQLAIVFKSKIKGDKLETTRLLRFGAAVMVIFGLIFSGCGSTKPDISEPVQSTQEGASGSAEQDTTIFDPMELGDDGILVPRPEKPVEEPKVAEPAPPPVEERWEIQERPGYRVQIYASNINQSARDVESKASLQFSEEVHLTYDPPMYKVRVGDCLSKDEADKLRQKAVSIGYKDAWVVRDKISVKVKVKG